ncbi:MAG: ABC transporter permease [Cyclobacteriaceae bacterium]|nr:ABC transporter permease [Cyclobacteriaceae bacterium]
MQNLHQPPQWATRFLRWYCRPDLAEDLEGDLFEYYQRHVQERGLLLARLVYVADVIKFMRPYTLRKPEWINLIIHWLMLNSYIKTSGRNMVRNKLFTTINVLGLAISMAVGLLMIGILSDVSKYDQFHQHHSRIYRVISRYIYLGKEDNGDMATTSMRAGKLIKEKLAQPEAVSVLRRDFEGDFTVEDKTLPLNGLWSNEEFFKVFSFKLLKGNPTTALKDPFSVVLTEQTAVKLFGDADPMGKTLTMNRDRLYTVTGIMEDVPVYSHMKFQLVGSISTREITAKDDKDEYKWDNIWSTWVYLLLPEGTSPDQVVAEFDKISKQEDPSVKNTSIRLRLQPLDAIMTTDNQSNEIGPTMGRTTLLLLGALTLVVLLSAGFNYTNLSIARSLNRTREVGIRKAIGALRIHVITQFVVEAVMVSLIGLVLALGIFTLVKPLFIAAVPGLKDIIVLDISPALVGWFVLFAIAVGVAAGLFPALFFARVNAVQVLKDFTTSRFFRRLTMRRVLIVFQYTVSIVLMTSTIVAVKQYRHYVNFDLGFSTDHVLNIPLQGNKPELLKKELTELPEVKGISQSLLITSVGNYWGTNAKYAANPLDSAGVYYNTIDENYLPLHGHKLLAGRNFTAKADSAAETEVIVNEQVLKRFQIAGQNPQKAVGDYLKVDGKDMQIIGVMKDFQYGRANDRNNNREVVFRYSPTQARLLNVKIQSDDILATRQKIEAIWKKIDPIHPFESRFYSEQIEEAFQDFKSAVMVAGAIAFLAIFIATMGLLGMVVFTTETRLKEISIRKVLGASDGKLLVLLGKGFVTLLLIATVIGLPITIVFFEKVAFPELGNHAPLAVSEMLLGVAAVLAMALLMITAQTWKVARSNPAEVLKAEG